MTWISMDSVRNYLVNKRYITYICLIAFGVHFYRMAGRFLDADEYYIFSAIIKSFDSRIYTDYFFIYPPVMVWTGKAVFSIFHDLYAAIFVSRLIVITLALSAFYLVLNIMYRHKLQVFSVPLTLFVLNQSQLGLKLIEYRSDGFAVPVLIAMAYLIYRLSEPDFRVELKSRAYILFMFLCAAALLATQKTVCFIPLLLFALLISDRADFINWFLRFRIQVALAVILTIFIVFSVPWLRSVTIDQYLQSFEFFRAVPAAMPEFNNENKISFFLRFMQYNSIFWTTAVIVVLMLFAARQVNRMVVPLSLIVGGIVLNMLSFFPFVQYHNYLVWAVLFCFPFSVRGFADRFPAYSKYLFLSLLLLSGASFIYNNNRFDFGLMPAKEYTSLINKVKKSIEGGKVFALGCSTLDTPSVGPFMDAVGLYAVEKSRDNDLVISILKNTPADYIYLEERQYIKSLLNEKEKSFVASNYHKCNDLPLLKNSLLVSSSNVPTSRHITIGGLYHVKLFPANTAVRLDGKSIKNEDLLEINQGSHDISSDQPSIVLMERKVGVPSSIYEALDKGRNDYRQIGAVFGDHFELVGISRSVSDGKIRLVVFWRALRDINEDLMAFHHLVDDRDRHLGGVDITPDEGWLEVRARKKGDLIAYPVTLDLKAGAGKINIGWFYQQDWSKRLRHGKDTYYSIPATL